jgi:hypothetical protein
VDSHPISRLGCKNGTQATEKGDAQEENTKDAALSFDICEDRWSRSSVQGDSIQHGLFQVMYILFKDFAN